MAKVLDALERARQERMRRLNVEGGPEAVPEPDDLPVPAEPRRVEPARPAPAAPATPAGRHRLVVAPGGREPAEILVSLHEDDSPVAEQLRHVCANMEGALTDFRTRIIAVSSPVSGDGKSVITANLVCVLADSLDNEVLLIDADMRKPDQHRLMGTAATPGLAEYLRGQATLEEAIHDTALPNLKLIPAGRTPAKPTTLLESDRMHQLISSLQPRFRWIVFDTPPLLPVVDATVIARECAGLLMVVRMGKTARNVIERAQTHLAESQLPVLGCILNDYRSRGGDDSYYYRHYARNSEKQGDGFSS